MTAPPPTPATVREEWLDVKRRHHSVAITGHRMTYRCGCCSEAWPCEDAKAAHRSLRLLDEAEIVQRGALVRDRCRLVPDAAPGPASHTTHTEQA